MTKLTTEITIEELQYRINAHENDLTQMWTADYFLNVQKELLALKQAAKNPAEYKVVSRFGDISLFNHECEAEMYRSMKGFSVTPLYAAPVLSKQPEPVAWTDSDELKDAKNRGSAYLFSLDGEANKFADPRRKIMLYTAPPAQPALVENLKKVMNSWLAMELKLAYQPEFTDVMMLLDAEPAPAQPVIPRWPSDEVERDALRYRFLRDKDFFGDEDEQGLVGWEGLVELSYNEFDAAVDARISHPNIDYVKLDTALRKHIPAQPVSEPKAEGDFLSRLKAEHAELEDRCIKLANFIEVNPAFKNLAPRMQRLLKIQAAVMVEYDSILECRIYLIEDAAAPAQESE